MTQQGGGVSPSQKSVKFGDLYGDLPVPTKTGYSFVGWKYSNELVTSTTKNLTQGDHTLTASWGHSVKFDYNNGTLSNSLSPTYAGEVGTTTSLPSTLNPTYSGHTFAGWHYGKNLIEPTTFTGSNFIALGRDYMFTDKFTVVVRAYMDDWTKFGTKKTTLISCTERGGWSLSNEIDYNAVNYISFAFMSEKTNSYIHTYSSITFSQMSSGYHTFIGTFDGSYARLYIDGILVGTSANASTTIKYDSSNGIFVGAEAEANTVSPYGYFFTGKVDYVSIENSTIDEAKNIGANLITGTNFDGSNYISLGKAYKYKSKIAITIRASMNDWSKFSLMSMISCTNGGGWAIEAKQDVILFAAYDSSSNDYNRAFSSIKTSELKSGYHTFVGIFNGEDLKLYIDDELVANGTKFGSKNIKYYPDNGIFVGAEAGNNTSSPEVDYYQYFKGTISYVSIDNTFVANKNSYIYQDFDVVATAIWN